MANHLLHPFPYPQPIITGTSIVGSVDALPPKHYFTTVPKQRNCAINLSSQWVLVQMVAAGVRILTKAPIICLWS